MVGIMKHNPPADKAASPAKITVEVGETGYADHPILLVLNGNEALLDQINETVMPEGEDRGTRYPLAFKTADSARAFLAELRKQGTKAESAAPRTTINNALQQVVESLAQQQKK